MNTAHRVGSVALAIVTAFVGCWLVVPMLITIPMSFTGENSFQFPPRSWSTDYYVEFFTTDEWIQPMLASVQIALAVTGVSVVIGVAAAFALWRARFRGRSVVQGLGIAPLIVPAVVTAIAIYALFLEWGLVGTFLGFLIAHTVIAVPFVIVTVLASLRSFDSVLLRASASLGATPMTTFRRVTVPMILPGVISGAVFAFVASFDELVVSLFLADPFLRTLPVQMYTSVTTDINPTVAVASTVTIIGTSALVALGLAIRRLGVHRG